MTKLTHLLLLAAFLSICYADNFRPPSKKPSPKPTSPTPAPCKDKCLTVKCSKGFHCVNGKCERDTPICPACSCPPVIQCGTCPPFRGCPPGPPTRPCCPGKK